MRGRARRRRGRSRAPAKLDDIRRLKLERALLNSGRGIASEGVRWTVQKLAAAEGGNGLQDYRLLDANYSSVYFVPIVQ
jgi:hypothetical protein